MFKKLFGGKDNNKGQGQSHFQVKPEYQNWRNLMFSLNPSDYGFDASGDKKVFGTIMDVGLPGGTQNLVVSVSAMSTLECSMRTSFGGGLSGVGEHPQINQHLRAILPLTEKLLPPLKKQAPQSCLNQGMYISIF